ncbi:MAG: BTAD domain-containing putative transcriptional regulator [Gallionella sp.]|nr:BTAD domain-containing putative transcriptional regulator [Gallionella sp.]
MKKGQLAASKTKALSLALLGHPDVRVAGIPVDAGYAKLRGLLALLALSAEAPLRREYLAELFWPDMPLEAGRQNLRRALFNLKSAMGEMSHLLSAKRDTVTLNRQGLWLDVEAFTAATPSCTSAPAPDHCTPCLAQIEPRTELYRGEFMEGFTLPDCPDFEDWLMIQRETLHRRALALLEQLSNCREQIGDYNKALQFALRYIELEPWDENAHRRVMRLYALNGQNSSAIAQYETSCHLLKKELGVLPGEETRQLAERIRNGKIVHQMPAAIPALPPRTVQQPLAELRQVTVLYCELNLAAIDDQDEAMALLSPAQTRCTEIIRQFFGHIVQTHGGGLLAYFGYPQADEFSARRAVQAALAITREANHNIEIRAGVHTGLIITGDDSSMPDAVGKTSRHAIQLRQRAAPNEVAISLQTYRLVDWYFDCTSLGCQPLSGMAQPVEIFRVSGESGARTRLDRAIQLTPLIGRKAEITKLTEFWKKAVQGIHHIVLVEGEAGIGKTRLLHALKERLAGQLHTLRELRCFPEFSQSPFYPLIAMLEAIFGFAHGDSPEVKSEKLAQYLETHFPASTRDSVPLLTQLLSLPLSENHQSTVLTPQKQKEQTIDILLDLLHALAWQQPLLFIVEDLHWIDPSTLELLSLLVEQAGRGPLLAVFTTRPEFVPPWKNALKSALLLAPLDEDDAAEMVVSINDDIPAATLRSIVERADGVPLFIEEMAKIATLDSQANIPVTLHDLLAARIDHLGEARYTAQLAATIGREFDLNLLRKVSPCDSATLTHNLGALQDAGLILRLNDTTRQFKHALIQEAAYQSQSRANRQAAHGRIAQVLQSDFPVAVTAQPELLARHFAAAGEAQPAIEYWHKAGQLAAGNSANLEAMKHFNSALQLLLTLPADMDRHRTELTILVSFCPVLYAVKGYGSEEANRANTRISELGELLEDSTELFMAKWAQVMNTVAGAGSCEGETLQIAFQLVEMANNDSLKKQAAFDAVATAAFWMGEFETARSHAEQALALYHPDHCQTLQEQFGEDLSIASAAYLSSALYFLGLPDLAQQAHRQSLIHARKLAHPHTLAQSLCFAAGFGRLMKQPAVALSLSAEAIAISRQHDFSVWLACGEMTHGWALVMHGQTTEGIAEIKSGIAGMRATVSGIPVTFLSALAEAYLYLKMHDEALAVLAEAQADAAETGDHHFNAELHRLKGECLLALAPSSAAQAEACFDQALAVSRQQQAKSLELRAAMSMARLWQRQGKQNAAQRLLAGVYNWFTQGFDTPDMREAAILLRQE